MIGNLALELSMRHGLLELFIKFGDEAFASRVVEIAGPDVFFKMFRFVELPAVKHSKNKSIDDERFENLGEVKGEREASVTGFVKEADSGIELRSVDLGETGGIHQRVSERDCGVDGIVWGSAYPLFKSGFQCKNRIESGVIDVSCGTLIPHQFVRVFRRFAFGKDVFNCCNLCAAILISIGMVSQDSEHVEACGVDKLVGKFHPLGAFFVVLDLFDEQGSGVEIFSVSIPNWFD